MFQRRFRRQVVKEYDFQLNPQVTVSYASTKCYSGKIFPQILETFHHITITYTIKSKGKPTYTYTFTTFLMCYHISSNRNFGLINEIFGEILIITNTSI